MARWIALALALVVVLVAAPPLTARPQQAPDSAAALQAAIGRLSDFNDTVRTEAARTLRRAPAEVVVPILAAAVRTHGDEYVRYRALTLLSGFPGPTSTEVMMSMRGDKNDRARMVAYAWVEHNPDPALLPALIDAFAKETSEFVRPALTRALAAQAKDPRARDVLAPLVMKGADFFRGSIIEALGEYGGRFALADIAAVAELEGPLQDDAVTAVGRLGDASQVPLLAKLQKTGRQQLQPTISAALCLLGRACPEAERYLKETLDFASRTTGYQALLRGAVHAQGMLALNGTKGAVGVLLDAGLAAKTEPARAPVVLGLGLIALKQPELIMAALEARKDLDDAVELFVEAFDMLNEDFEEERFFVAVRRAYWAAPADSARRRVAEALITKLEF
jgi:HEAT repeat protein